MTTYITVIKVYLTPKHDIVLTNFTGTVVESFFLKLLDRIEPGLGDKLHSEKRPKPFSVTPFFVDGRPVIGYRPVVVRAGSVLWFRVSIVGDLGTKLIPLLTDLMYREVNFFKISAKFVVSNIEARIVSTDAFFEPGSTVFKIRFLSPTRFAIKKPRRSRRPRYCFCPEAWRIVKSSLKHWRNFVDIHISDKIVEWSYYYVVLADFGTLRGFRSNVVTVRLPRGGVARGYVGFALYQVLGRRRLHELWALLRYAQLMNVGTGRSMGLGVVEIIELKPRSEKTRNASSCNTS